MARQRLCAAAGNEADDRGDDRGAAQQGSSADCRAGRGRPARGGGMADLRAEAAAREVPSPGTSNPQWRREARASGVACRAARCGCLGAQLVRLAACRAGEGGRREAGPYDLRRGGDGADRGAGGSNQGRGEGGRVPVPRHARVGGVGERARRRGEGADGRGLGQGAGTGARRVRRLPECDRGCDCRGPRAAVRRGGEARAARCCGRGAS